MPNTSKLYNVEVVQFWQGEEEPRRPYPLHWAIYVETGPSIGNTYQIIGNSDNYTIDIKLDQPFENRKDWRGSFIVGTVSWAELSEMERILATVDIVRNVPSWNSHDWVMSALISLLESGLSGIMIMSESRLKDLRDNMCWLLESWPRIENVVEYVGGEDLTCLVSNKKTHEWHWSAPDHECDGLCESLKELVNNTYVDFNEAYDELND